MNGVRRADYVRALSATADDGGLALSQTSIVNYWYWASGVGVAGTLSPYAHAVLQDISPSGRILTYPAVYADAAGAFSVLAKYDQFLPEVGAHTLRLTDDYGNVKSAVLEVTADPGARLKVSVSPATMTRTSLYDHGITVTVSGLAPRGLAHLVIFTPTGLAYETGPNGYLQADSNGVLSTVLDLSTGTINTGTWEASVVAGDNQELSGYATFTVSGPLPKANKVVTLAPRITQAALAIGSGEKYTARRFAPFEIVEVDLTTPTGQIVIIGRYRANGAGGVVGGILGDNAALGRYLLTITSVRTGDHVAATFTVTDAVGNSPTPPAVSLSTSISRLAAMDPSKGLRFTASGFSPGAVVYLSVVRSSDSVRMILSDRSRAAVPADATGKVSFQVTPLNVPATGRYDVTLTNYTDPLILRTTITITP